MQWFRVIDGVQIPAPPILAVRTFSDLSFPPMCKMGKLVVFLS